MEEKSLHHSLKLYRSGGSVETPKKQREKLDPKIINNDFDRDPKQSLRRISKKLEISHGSVQKLMKLSGYNSYMANIVQKLYPND